MKRAARKVRFPSCCRDAVQCSAVQCFACFTHGALQARNLSLKLSFEAFALAFGRRVGTWQRSRAAGV